MEDKLKIKDNLKLLSVFHYIFGGLGALFSLIPLAHVVIGVTMLISPEKITDEAGNVPPVFVGWLFALMGALAIILGLAFAVCLICSGRFLSKGKRYVFCLVMSAITCMLFPFGTILGVFTIIALKKDGVRETFE